MAVRKSDDVAFFLIDGYSVLGVMTQFSDNREISTEDLTVLGSQWVEHGSTGIRSANISQQGFYDDVVGGIHDALNGQQGTHRVLAYSVAGNDVGSRFTAYSGALQTTFERTVPRGEFQKANAAYIGSGAADDGVILQPYGAVTADGDSEDTPVDGGASSAGGGAAVLQVTALTLGGHTGLGVKVRHSADNVTYADLATFAAVTTAPAADVVEVAGTVNRYLAASWDFAGAGTGPQARMMVGFARR